MQRRDIPVIFLLLVFWGCDRTDIRNKGVIAVVEKSQAVYDPVLTVEVHMPHKHQTSPRLFARRAISGQE